MMKKQIHILGGGITGLTIAVELLKKFGDQHDITVVEQQEKIGGMAGSFNYDGLTLDYGSHRLHPATPQHIMDDIRTYLDGDLLMRPRNGRIRLMDTYIRFPLSPSELLTNLPLSFKQRFFTDLIKKPFSRKFIVPSSFAAVLRQDLGDTICETFYFPFARKLWGLEPEEIAPLQARRRVAAQGMTGLIKKALAGGSSKKKSFFYPRNGFGQLCRALADECINRGGSILTSADIQQIQLKTHNASTVTVRTSATSGEPLKSVKTDFVFSTLPLPVIMQSFKPQIPPAVRESVACLRYRSLVLLYVILETDRFTQYDAHYFPETDLPFSRICEPKNYTDRSNSDKTALCVEIPCFYNDAVWNASVETLSREVTTAMETAGLPIRCPVEVVFTKKFRYAYPIYDLKYGWQLTIINTFLENIRNFVSLGRQGMFLHDNVHHDMDMAYTAAQCMHDNLSFDTDAWLTHQARFKEQTVED